MVQDWQNNLDDIFNEGTTAEEERELLRNLSNRANAYQMLKQQIG